MTQPIRVQLSRSKGFRLADAAGNGLPTVKVDRSTKYGNNYRSADRADDVRRFRALAASDTDSAEAARQELRGKNLACWCALPKPGEPDICHAAVLIEIANAPEAT